MKTYLDSRQRIVQESFDSSSISNSVLQTVLTRIHMDSCKSAGANGFTGSPGNSDPTVCNLTVSMWLSLRHVTCYALYVEVLFSCARSRLECKAISFKASLVVAEVEKPSAAKLFAYCKICSESLFKTKLCKFDMYRCHTIEVLTNKYYLKYLK